MGRPRYASLDVLRGMAIAGTLGTNIWIYTHPEGLVGYFYGTPDSAWRPVEIVLQMLTQGKFLGLLTVMFGIGLALQQDSALRAGRRWPGTYPWRAALLLVDGILHFLLMTEFDVLMGYAITGWVVSYLLVTTPRTQWRVIGAALAVHLVVLGALTVTLAVTGGGPDSGIEAARPALDPNPYADGSWWDLVVFRWENLALFRSETVLIFPMSIALFLLGARLVRAGVLDARGTVLRRALMGAGFGVALPLDVFFSVVLQPLKIDDGTGLLASRYGTAPVVALGLLAAVAEFYVRRPRHRPGFAARRLGEVGRTALSSYVLQNLVASAICYGWGLGVAARLSAEQRVPATVAIYLTVLALISAFAHLWLRRFDRGPVEWLWNRSHLALTAGRTRSTTGGS